MIAGTGPEEKKVRALIAALELDTVHLENFVQYEDLPALYRRAGALILPSLSETWGLVVNEAMAAGLPVLVSNRCGCVPDLVYETCNGFTFDPHNTEVLARLMAKIASMQEGERAAMGQASLHIISHWTPDTFSEGLRNAVRVALSASRPKANAVDQLLLWTLINRSELRFT